MGSTATVLKVCYATQESGGDSADDYVELPQEFTQLTPPSFHPARTFTGAAQSLSVTAANNGTTAIDWSGTGDMSLWTQANCTLMPGLS